MASYSERKNKDGKIISYQIKVSRGRDKLTGKQLKPFTTTFTPPEGWSRKAIERELQKVMGEFEATCKRGEVLTKEELKAKAAADKEQEKQRAEEERRKPTFNTYVQTFLDEKRVTLSPVTICNYERALNRAAAVFGEIKLVDVDYLSIKNYFTDMQATGETQFNKTPFKHSTIMQHYTILHNFFENAVDNEVIEINPMQRMKPPQRRKDEEIEPTITYNESEVKYIIECLNNEPLKWRALMMFALDSGCREGEIMGLKWSEIYFSTGKVNICRNVQYTPKKGVFITTPKNKRLRTITINQPVLDVLAEWKREQSRLNEINGIPQNGFCFPRENGEPAKPKVYNDYLESFGKRYNLPGIHPHALRHTMATISIANGADIVSVSRKLGHSTPDITMRVYSHANEEAQQRANDIFANAIYSDSKSGNDDKTKKRA